MKIKNRQLNENRFNFKYFSQHPLLVAPPVVSVSKQSRKVSVGTNVTLTCHARGNPEPAITWSRRNAQLPRS